MPTTAIGRFSPHGWAELMVQYVLLFFYSLEYCSTVYEEKKEKDMNKKAYAHDIKQYTCYICLTGSLMSGNTLYELFSPHRKSWVLERLGASKLYQSSLETPENQPVLFLMP